MKIEMPQAVKEIIERLESAGYEAFAVGGCVRDAVLGRVPADWDITTSAMPEEVKGLFSRTIDTGIQHGTVTVMKDHVGYEVTTYRIDGEYEDARHPKEVSFTSNLVEDLKRRDFTINAMAYNDRVGIVDEFDGIEDLEKGIIRCVGEAKDRFGEDALRMLRAVRFSAQLGFKIDETTKEAINELAPNLEKISAERIQAELVKLLVSDHPEYLREAYETGITAVVLPEFDDIMKQEQNDAFHENTVGEHTLRSLLQVENDKVLRLTMLFHDVGKPMTYSRTEEGVTRFFGHPDISSDMSREIMRRLKFDNDTTDKVKKLTAVHDLFIKNAPNRVRRAMSKVGKELFPYFLKVRKANILAWKEDAQEKALADLKELTDIYEGILERGECVCIKELVVDGKDLIAAGVQQGKQIGEILNELLEIVLEEPEKNKKETLLNYVKETYLS
ncbi:MAG: CCA tRNA nucleotidyltransferase [Lachnospiraceae bacterium]|nr:CCA tRNA nucleotidyltransferase [Lachnospiraceae bacterium]